MNNQIIWGLPHIFAVFMIIISSGVLNIASLSSVFDKEKYKPLAPLSGLIAISYLIGGLAVLVLDLGRPDRLIVAMTTYNFKSIFAWNIFLYSGFFLVLLIYLWTMLDYEIKKYSKSMGIFAFVWRIILTTGTGSIFGFLVAREAYATAILAPLFIVMSLLYGVAIYYAYHSSICWLNKTKISQTMLDNFKKLMIIFLFTNLYFLILYHITNIYISKHLDYEIFLLVSGGIYTLLFWVGQFLIGIVLPLILLIFNKNNSPLSLLITSKIILLGGLFAVAVIIIGGQAYPLNIFPDHQIIESAFYDNVIHSYVPSIYELGLGIGGLTLATLIILIGIANFKFIPKDI
ncbi:MAG: NrfD/PsrC family molybdoenzyme membrane anchor subunit [Pseudomonadota bacterium]|nr:NrfD/PsrC family molybdoenzyme membrane anchor subunit [Pseudomonadota bacterium]MEC8996280.1 NrfD/PsrC family molybdoenzyme membrane anchor subunit [Pseudomonadota bacterium]MED5275191.1 NrfD/PsrC family molybdoenzyme membrane anchor subunit [Pseudomonadota bacterium]